MSLAQNIKKLCLNMGLTQGELAEKINVTRSTITQWETGWTQPRMGAIERMASVFNVSVSDIVSEDVPVISGAMKAISNGESYLPLVSLGRVHAGVLTDEEVCEKTVNVPSDIAKNHPNALVLEVEGSCMNKVIPEGAHILIDPEVYPSNGSIVVVETEDYRAILRRWYRGNKSLMLVADSYEEFEDLIFTSNEQSIKVIGTVVWFQASSEMN
ncbi:MAG: helix-turn-helix domain-containing protein [Atopobium sp.]|nr:helix-turn-helix domain-containing protein [Atopobium sp.]